METKVIRTEEQYYLYLDEIQSLMAQTSSLSSKESDRLEVLTLLIEAYENSKYPVEPPDPIDAIKFRMEEQGLKQADLIPYFGTSGRVSEVLRRKRPLTVQMLKALAIGLGISADTLLGLSMPNTVTNKKEIDWSKFPAREMMRRGWIETSARKTKSVIKHNIEQYIADAGLQFGAASFRRTLSGEANTPTTKYALYAWLARIIQRARTKKTHLAQFNNEKITSAFLRELAQFSWAEHGPLLAVEFLEAHGIAVVIEPHLKGTLLDGAALKDLDGTPIIGLTLRYDRLDNFWFTLIHEVAHIWKHVNNENAFLDDLSSSSEDRREAEANRLTREAFIPRIMWKRSEAFLNPSKKTIESMAKELKIHPAIIVGRLRREMGDHRLFPDLLGQDEVKHLFHSEPTVGT